MAFNIQFNAATVQPNTAMEPLPGGTYDVMIVDTDEELVKDGNGQSFFKVTMQVVNGEFTGRKIIDRLNVKHDNAETARIAWGTWSAICYVTGVMVIQQSSAEVHGKHFKIKVSKGPMRVKDDKGKYVNDPSGRESNEIRGYLDSMGYEPGKNPGVAAAVSGGFGGQPQQQVQQQQPQGFGQPVQQQTQQFQPQPDQMQAAPQFVQKQHPPQTMQQQPQGNPPPSFAAQPQQQASAPPPSFAAPAAASPPPSFAQQPQQTIEHVPQPQQQQQIDPSASAGQVIPSWASGQ